MPEFPKMNPEVKEKWLESLRSGKFLQGEEYLLKETEYGEEEDDIIDIPRRYCCLGVLCTLEGSPEKPVDGQEFPQDKTLEWAGLTKTSDNGKMYGSSHYLASLNDGKQYPYMPKSTFSQIADWIEKNL